MAVKMFELPEESLSSEDTRIKDFLKEKYGGFKSSGGVSFSLTKEELFQLKKIFNESKVDRVWGFSNSGKWGESIIDYLVVVANKKMYLIYKRYGEVS